MIKAIAAATDIQVSDPDRAIYLLSNARNTKYAFLKDFIIKRKESSIRIIPKKLKGITIDDSTNISLVHISSPLQLVQYIIENKPDDVTFKHTLAEEEKERIPFIAEHYSYQYELTESTLRLFR